LTTYDQAKELRVQMEEIKEKNSEVDILLLPPRSEVHKNTKTKWKIKYPTIRLLALIFILLPITILSIYYLHDRKVVNIVSQDGNGSYETIELDVNISDGRGEQTARGLSSSRESIHDHEKAFEPEEVIAHIVQENETLYSIAMKYYQSAEGMDIIKKWNKLENSAIHKGQVLEIPLLSAEK